MNKFYLSFAMANTLLIGYSLNQGNAFGVLVFGLFTAYWLWKANL